MIPSAWARVLATWFLQTTHVHPQLLTQNRHMIKIRPLSVFIWHNRSYYVLWTFPFDHTILFQCCSQYHDGNLTEKFCTRFMRWNSPKDRLTKNKSVFSDDLKWSYSSAKTVVPDLFSIEAHFKCKKFKFKKKKTKIKPTLAHVIISFHVENSFY